MRADHAYARGAGSPPPSYNRDMRVPTSRLADTADANHWDVAAPCSALRGELLHAGVGPLLLVGVEVSQFVVAPHASYASSAVPAEREFPWARVVGIHAVGIALLIVIAHLTAAGRAAQR